MIQDFNQEDAESDGPWKRVFQNDKPNKSWAGLNRKIKLEGPWARLHEDVKPDGPWKRLSYGVKVLVWYLGLCLIALLIYAFIEWKIGLNISDPSDKGSITALVVGMVAWTVMMIVPIAAYYAISDWRGQQRAANLSRMAMDLMDRYEALLSQLYKVQAHACTVSKVLRDLELSVVTQNEKIMLFRNEVESLPPNFLLPFRNKARQMDVFLDDEVVYNLAGSIIGQVGDVYDAYMLLSSSSSDYMFAEQCKDIYDLIEEYLKIYEEDQLLLKELKTYILVKHKN